MSDNWDDDDYDPAAHLAAQASDKIATLGLDEVIKQQQKPSNSVAQDEDTQIANSKKAGTTAKPIQTPMTNIAERELTEMEKREAQLRSDAAAAMDLFGVSIERKEPTFEDLHTKADFEAYADRFGQQIAAGSSHPHYLFFVNSLVDHIIKPMNKVQLQSVRDIVQAHLDVHLKREEEQQKRKQEQQSQKEKQKTKKKQVREDLVEGEYDDYDEKFNRY